MKIVEYKIIAGRVEEIRRVRMPYRAAEGPVRRGKRAKPSSVKKIMANEQERVRRLAREINANFVPGDLWLTLRYGDERLPESEAEAVHRVGLFLRRISAAYQKQTGQKLKWIAADGLESTKGGEKPRLHHHILLPGLAYDLIIRHWPEEELTYRRLDGRRDYTGVARYMLQNAGNEKNRRRWRTSRGLEKPVYTEPVPVEDFDGIRAPKGAEIRENSLLVDAESGTQSAYMRYVRKAPFKRKGGGGCSESSGGSGCPTRCRG